jgi:hypothetical protein
MRDLPSLLLARRLRSFHPYCCGFIEFAAHCPRAGETRLLFKENWRAVSKMFAARLLVLALIP